MEIFGKHSKQQYFNVVLSLVSTSLNGKKGGELCKKLIKYHVPCQKQMELPVGIWQHIDFD